MIPLFPQWGETHSGIESKCSIRNADRNSCCKTKQLNSIATSKNIGPNLFPLLNTWLSSSSMHANPIPLSQHTAAAIESQAEGLNALHTM